MNKQNFRLRLLPTVLFTACVILIVRARAYSQVVEDIPNVAINSSSQSWDLFSYAKSSAIFAITVYAALTMTYLLVVGSIKIKKTIIYIPMLIYSAGVIASYVMSDYKLLAMGGSVNRFEGTRTIICYMFMLFYTINVVDELRDALIIVSSVLISAFLCCLIGITQLLGHDILLSDVAKHVMAVSDNCQLSAVFSKGQVYQTVANMNYVGMYLALIVPVLMYSLYFLEKNKGKQVLLTIGIDQRKYSVITLSFILLLVMIGLNVYGAQSIGGVIGMAASLAILLILLLEKGWQKILVAIMCSFALIGMLIYVYASGTDNHNNTGHRQIEYIQTGIDCVNMSIDGNELSIRYNRASDNYELRDGDGNAVDVVCFDGEEGTYRVNDIRYVIRITPFNDVNGEACIYVEVMDNEWESFGFTFYEDGARYLNPYGQEIPLERVESFGFKNHLSAGSGRGYIWSRTVPLLKGRILIGSGADTFLAVFPQDDYAGKYTSGTPLNIVFDKPHSIYLNMAVGTGVLSLVAFLAMVGIILRKAFRRSDDNKYIKVIAAGIVGFLVAGIFNDSSVCTMPMFYGLLGTVAALSK